MPTPIMQDFQFNSAKVTGREVFGLEGVGQETLICELGSYRAGLKLVHSHAF